MLTNTLKLLIKAGKDALGATCGIPVINEDITQIGQGNLEFPSFGEVAFSGGTLQRIHLGCDAQLSDHLAENFDKSGSDSGSEILTNRFLDSVLKGMKGRYPRGWIESNVAETLNLPCSGVRSYGICLETEIGHFYLMAEIPSRSELQEVRGPGYFSDMVASHLPKGWAGVQKIVSMGNIDDFLIFLRKTELDVQVEVSAEDETFIIHTGMMLETTKVDGSRAFRLVMDFSGPEVKALKQGDEVRIKVGVQNRALSFISRYLGKGKYPIAGSAAINCVELSLPSVLNVEQRRLAFRINSLEHIRVEIEYLDHLDDNPPQAIEESLVTIDESPVANDENPSVAGEIRGDTVRGRLADLSFSGARIIAEPDKMTGWVKANSQVMCCLSFPGAPSLQRIKGIIRWASISLADGDNQQDEFGLEFLEGDDSNRPGLHYIREYILSQQRLELAKRVHVAGVEQW